LVAREGIELEVLANRVEAHSDGWHVRCVRLRRRRYSDRSAALAAARDSLATHLDELGVLYESFDDLKDVTAALAR